MNIPLSYEEGLYLIKYDPSTPEIKIWGVSPSSSTSLTVRCGIPTSDFAKYFRFDTESSGAAAPFVDLCLKIVLSNNQTLFVNFENVTSEDTRPNLGSPGDEDSVMIRLSPFQLNLQ